MASDSFRRRFDDVLEPIMFLIFSTIAMEFMIASGDKIKIIFLGAQQTSFFMLCSCTNDHLLFVKLSDNNTCHGLVLFPAFYVYLLVAKLPNSLIR